MQILSEHGILGIFTQEDNIIGTVQTIIQQFSYFIKVFSDCWYYAKTISLSIFRNS